MTAVLETYQEGVYTITLNRPEKKNAMDYDLLKGLDDALKRAQKEEAPFVVIRGSGKAFCSGGDIVAFKSAPDTEALIDAEAGVLHESIKRIRTMKAIVIAAIEGVAVGAGVGLALACDLSIATKKTIMNMGYRNRANTRWRRESLSRENGRREKIQRILSFLTEYHYGRGERARSC